MNLHHTQQTPIKGPVHNYDPHNFDDVYADEYGGYGSGMNTNFRNGSAGTRFGAAGGERGGMRGGERFGADRATRGGFDRPAGRGGLDRAGATRGGRDFVDPWAHNMNGTNSVPPMGGGPMGTSFGNNGMGNMGGNGNGMASLNNMGMNNNATTFGTNSMDMDGKTSTQVTIPKDVSSYEHAFWCFLC